MNAARSSKPILVLGGTGKTGRRIVERVDNIRLYGEEYPLRAQVETTSGLTAVTGYEPDGPRYRTTLFYADPVAGIHGAVAIMAALLRRNQTGEGEYLDVSVAEGVLSLTSLHIDAQLLAKQLGQMPKRYIELA
ncbi:MAG: CoA transferase, partial [Acidobacteria bacterium]|nr:CoA transferase [Acidobacteriota bacterium]